MSGRSEPAVRLAVHAMRDAAILLDRQGIVRQVNAAFENLSGFAESELFGRPLPWLLMSGFGKPGEADWPKEPSGAVWDEVLRRAYRYRRKDGGFFWGETFNIPCLDGNGAPDGHCQIMRDVSDRVRRAEGLMALVAFVADQSIHRDHDMSALLTLGCDYFGLDVGILCSQEDDADRIEAVGGSLDLVAPGDKLLGHDRLSSVIVDGDAMAFLDHTAQPQRTMPQSCRDAGIVTLLACVIKGAEGRYGTLCFGGRQPHRSRLNNQEKQILHFIARWIGVRWDIAAAWQSYRVTNWLLAKSEERYRYLYQKTPAMLHSIDDAGRLASVSDAWLTTMGYERDEVIGRPSTDFLTEESRRRAVEVVLPAFQMAGRCDDVDYQFITKNGDVLDILLSAIAEYDENGRFSRSLAVLLDVTERRRIERALTDKTAALERSHADLARFAQIASHDLQEPLRRVITYAQILVEDVGPTLPAEAAQVAGVIQSGGRRLRLMINDLLSYIRLNDELDWAFEAVDMSAVLGQALDDLNEEIASRGARIDLAPLPLVWGRIPLLRSVFYHLISNAIKYAGDQSPAIAIAAEDGGHVWRFVVEDRGIGIEPRFAERIFQIFQRLDARDEGEGSGSGLAICRLIVQRCGGEIWLDRSYEKGARFLFTLPKTKPTTSDQPPPAGQTPLPTTVRLGD